MIDRGSSVAVVKCQPDHGGLVLVVVLVRLCPQRPVMGLFTILSLVGSLVTPDDARLDTGLEGVLF